MIVAHVSHRYSTQIRRGYCWLVEHYESGDKVCLFGFSRGAYIARCIGGMIHVVSHKFFCWSKHEYVDDLHFKVGLLGKGNEEHFRTAYNRYKNTSSNGVKKAQKFKSENCRNVPIEFMGVWYVCGSNSERLN